MKTNQESTSINVEAIDAVLNSPICSEEDKLLIKKLYKVKPELGGLSNDPVGQRYYPNEPWIQTHTGRRFNPTKPVVDSINIEDIAHALSNQCRFSGHCLQFYSVSQHSILTSYLCDKEHRLDALLHDASEAYLVDLPTPLKNSKGFEQYKVFEKQLELAIAEKFGTAKEMTVDVKIADKIMLATEARDLLSPRPDWKTEYEPLPFTIKVMSPDEAKKAFLKRFEELVSLTQNNGFESYDDDNEE